MDFVLTFVGIYCGFCFVCYWLSTFDTPQMREAALERKYGVDYRIHCEKKFGKNWRTVCKVDYSDVK
jgi:hypothetical protein